MLGKHFNYSQLQPQLKHQVRTAKPRTMHEVSRILRDAGISCLSQQKKNISRALSISADSTKVTKITYFIGNRGSPGWTCCSSNYRSWWFNTIAYSSIVPCIFLMWKRKLLNRSVIFLYILHYLSRPKMENKSNSQTNSSGEAHTSSLLIDFRLAKRLWLSQEGQGTLTLL